MHIFGNRRGFSILVLVLTAALVLSMTGCTQNKAYTTDYSMGLVTTSDMDYSSYIEYYDDNLELLHSVRYSYSAVGDAWLESPLLDGHLFMIPQGPATKRDSKMVLDMNLATGTIREYTVDRVHINIIAADEHFIYTGSNLNAVGTLSRVDRETGEVIHKDLPGETPLYLGAHNNRIYLLSSRFTSFDESDPLASFGEAESDLQLLTIYDQNLNVIASHDLSMYGDIGFGSRLIGKRLYIATITSDGTDGFLDTLYYYSLEDGSVNRFTDPSLPISAICLYKDTVIALHRTNQGTGNGTINFYDTETGETLSSLHLDYQAHQAVTESDTLYVMGQFCLVRYRINGADLIEEKRVDIEHAGTLHATLHHPTVLFRNE